MVKLAELGEVNRGRSRHRPRHAPHLYGGPYPFIQTGNIKASGGRIASYDQTYSEVGLRQSRLWPTGTMCITIAANIAETGILKFPACFPDSVIGFIADETKCDVYFVEYMFRYLKRHLQHAAEDSGTVQDNINLGTLDQLRFPLPPLSEQRAISEILCALDDKIELNRQMNHTLEATAQAIFKSWFVDFDPITAKAAGLKPYGMNDETAALFPSRFMESELGSIPEGWGVTNIGDVSKSVAGRSYSSRELRDSPTALVTLKSFKRGGGYKQEGLKPYVGTYKEDQIVSPGELVVARTDVTQNAEVIGRPAIVRSQSKYSKLVVSLDVMIVRSASSGISVPYLYFLMRTEDFENYIVGYANGTTVLHLSGDGLPSYRFAKPPPALVARFSDLAKSVLERIDVNEQQSRSLVAARDLLLPKLLSGELRPANAERLVGEVA